jgi:hypothetical protein
MRKSSKVQDGRAIVVSHTTHTLLAAIKQSTGYTYGAIIDRLLAALPVADVIRIITSSATGEKSVPGSDCAPSG